MKQPPRAPWREFPNVVLLAAESRTKPHPQYRAAKSGDTAAAAVLVRELVEEAGIVSVRRLIDGASRDAAPVLISVHAYESEGVNAIPVALAGLLEQRFGMECEDRVVQSNVVSHTGVWLFFIDDLSPVHRLFCSLTVTSVRFSRGQAPTGLFIGQPARAARPDQRCLGASVRPTGAAPGHSRSVLVACRGKGDASEMAVVTTTRLSGRAFRVALGATRGRGRLDRRRHRAGETLKTVGVCPLVGNAQRRWRES